MLDYGKISVFTVYCGKMCLTYRKARTTGQPEHAHLVFRSHAEIRIVGKGSLFSNLVSSWNLLVAIVFSCNRTSFTHMHQAMDDTN